MLVPYLLSTGSKAYETGSSSITPLAKHKNFIEKVFGDFDIHTKLILSVIVMAFSMYFTSDYITLYLQI